MSACLVCGSPSTLFGTATLLKKHEVSYFRCSRCGFIQTERPYWLREAYSSAIASQDVGIMFRNLTNCEVVSAVLRLIFPNTQSALDYGGGHGVLVRLLRDRGFKFFWSDLHASNDFARGFEAPVNTHFDFLTAFEVFEHLVNPVSEIAALMDLSDNVFLSTCLVPEPAPALTDWWYYMPSSGQHISFYTSETLRVIAERFNRRVLSVGTFHLFTKTPVSHFRYRLATSPKVAQLISRMHSRPSLIPGDLAKMMQ